MEQARSRTLDDLVGEYMLHRAFQRADIGTWVENLRDAGAVVLDLSHELEYREQRFPSDDPTRRAPTAAEALEPARVRRANFRLRELRGDEATYRARLLCCGGRLWRSDYERWSAPDADVGPLRQQELFALSEFLQRAMAARMRAWNDRFTGGLRAGARAGRSGNLPDVAAVRIIEGCNALGVAPALAAMHVIDKVVALGLEAPPNVGEQGSGQDERKQVAAAMLVDRWRKVAARARSRTK